MDFCMNKSVKTSMVRELSMKIDVVKECVFEEENKNQETIFVGIGEQEVVEEKPTLELLIRMDA